jgi:hypothetical protein
MIILPSPLTSRLSFKTIAWGITFLFVLVLACPLYAQTPNTAENLRPFEKKLDRCGYKEPHGKVIIKPRFGKCSRFSEGMALVQERGVFWGLQSFLDMNLSLTAWGYIDPTGKYLLQFKPHDKLPAGSFAEGLAPIYDTRSAKYGYIDHLGNIVLPPQFDHAESFSEGLAAVCSGQYHRPGQGFWLTQQEADKMRTHRCGFIGHSGQMIIPYSWEWVDSFHNGQARFREGNTLGYVDKTGKVISSTTK